ncbi:MAG: arginine--tRNA ligase [Catenulisporales bacterium]|nr:arginine--tRNA ligase [Catenulisporales bacterium]
MTEPRAPRVLVVDDSAAVRSLIRINLELEGFEVLEADSAGRCLESAAGADVVTLEVLLPEGLDVLRRIKRDPALGTVRVVAVTAAALPGDRRLGQAAGADAYLVKPFDPGELVETVRGLAWNPPGEAVPAPDSVPETPAASRTLGGVTPEQLSQAVLDTVHAAVADGALTLTAVPEAVTVERPKNRDHGDYATNVALQLTKAAGMPPRALAELLAERLRRVEGIAGVEVAGPGFLNLRLAAGAAGELARTVVEQGAAYGRSQTFAGQNVNLEFVSANPTGPLHLGHTRWAAVGDALGRLLEAAGARVTREFYINDAGNQMNNFGMSLALRANGQDVPEGQGLYEGAYIKDLAQVVLDEHPILTSLPEEAQVEAFRTAGYKLQLKLQQESLEKFRTHFDVWFSERSLHESGAVEGVADRLAEQGHVFERDGAVWLRTTDFGDDKDRVIVRSNGERTYFSADCAYYLDKRDRGFSPCIYMLGADHHGYVGRLKALAACSGDDPEKDIEVLIGQFVKMVKDGQEVKLSKRTGMFITLDDVIDMIGVDAARYALARSSVDNELVLDVDLLTTNSNENPVYYVQYMHARMCAVKRNAAEKGLTKGDLKPELLTHPREDDLLASLAEFPRVVAQAAGLRQVHKVAHYLEELAKRYSGWYTDCRILPDGDGPMTDLNSSRMWLAEATQTVLRNGLDLLGVSAPERM